MSPRNRNWLEEEFKDLEFRKIFVKEYALADKENHEKIIQELEEEVLELQAYISAIKEHIETGCLFNTQETVLSMINEECQRALAKVICTVCNGKGFDPAYMGDRDQLIAHRGCIACNGSGLKNKKE